MMLLLKILFSITLFAASRIQTATTTAHEFDSGGVKLHYASAGAGEPIVLIHGWQSDSTMWGRDAKGNTKLTAPEGFRAIALDCRGHGKSGKPHDVKAYGSEMVKDVARLLDHLKIEKAHIVGYSMGAFIAGKFAAMYPKRVFSIVYGGQAPWIVGAPETGSKEVEVFAEAVNTGAGLGAYILETTPENKPKPTKEQADALAKFLFANKDVKALAAAGLSFDQLAVTQEALRKCEAQTLFIHGSNESAGVKTKIEHARKVLPKSEHVVVPNTDHITTLMHPDFGKQIVFFLNKHKTAR